jgi:uncharacterized protein
MTKSVLQPGVEIQTLYSEILRQHLLLFIKLPFEYENEHKCYPTLYCLDGNYYFPFYSTPSMVYEAPWRNVKKIMIVGVGYVVNDDRMKGLAQIIACRTRDLTPSTREEVNQGWQEMLKTVFNENIQVCTGGADQFLKVIANEVIPFIETNYRADRQERGLAGYSLGGLFALFTLFQSSHLFQNFFVGSPAIWKELFDDEERFAGSHQDLNAKVFISVGEKETEFHESFNKMRERLESRAYPGLDLKTIIITGEDHDSSVAPSISRALHWLYYSD